MRKTFYELLNEREFSAYNEYEKLLNLFFIEKSVAVNRYLDTVENYIDNNYFRTLPFVGSISSVQELFNELHLKYARDDLDDLFLLCETLLALLPESEIEKDSRFRRQANSIFKNIEYILAKTGHEISEDRDGNKIITIKNKATMLAAEIVEDEEVSFDLIEYNHFALKGDLTTKRKILSTIGIYIEPILRDRTFKESKYKDLISDTGFVFNNFHIRHNNKQGAKSQEYIENIDDSELETWYDKAYDLALAVIITYECRKSQDQLSELKRTYHWKT